MIDTGSHVITTAPMTGTMLEPNADGKPGEVAISVPLGVHARVASRHRRIIEYSLDPGDNTRKDLMVRGDRRASKPRIFRQTALVRLEKYNWKHLELQQPSRIEMHTAITEMIRALEIGIESEMDEALSRRLAGDPAPFQCAARRASNLDAMSCLRDWIMDELEQSGEFPPAGI